MNVFKRISKQSRFGFIFAFIALLSGCEGLHNGLLGPAGPVAFKERQLFFNSLALMMIVLIPVVIMSIAFAVRYRASHPTAEYRPNWSHSYLLEALWWGIPCIIVIVLGVMTWIQTHKLDPYQRINSSENPMKIQAISLPWKWLFIYPEQNIATVNELYLPLNREVQFEITSDNEPMSSLFIPRLASQIYSMAGMRTELHVLATQTGEMQGMNTMYNGDGFSDMKFKVFVVDDQSLQNWVKQVKSANQTLSTEEYTKLMKPSKAEPVHYYSSAEPNLFKATIDKYNTVTYVPKHWDYESETKF